MFQTQQGGEETNSNVDGDVADYDYDNATDAAEFCPAGDDDDDVSLFLL